MDRTVLDIMTALKDEKQRILESLGNIPKKDPFEHGVQVGEYRGIMASLEVIQTILEDIDRREANL